jgi:hypothetical protein
MDFLLEQSPHFADEETRNANREFREKTVSLMMTEGLIEDA